MMTYSCNDPPLGESHTNQEDNDMIQTVQWRITTRERIMRKICTLNGHFSVKTYNFVITSQRSEQNIFNNIFTDKFIERVTLTKSNSGIA